MNKLNLHNLQKQFYIESIINPISPNYNNHLSKNVQKLIQNRHKSSNGRNEKRYIKGFLLDEANTVDEILEELESDDEDEITEELNNQMEEQKKINFAHIKMLNQ